MMIQVLAAFVAVFFFSVLLEIPKKYMISAGTVGGICWLVYLIAKNLGANAVMATFLGAFVMAILCQIFARIFKTPVTVFLIAGILPLVPGEGMYQIGYYMFQHNTGMTGYYITHTIQIAGAIAIALFLADSVFRVFQKGWKQNSLRYQEKHVDKKEEII